MTSDIGRDDVLNGLTPTMERCLAAVTAEQGQPAKTLPGGVNTVWALMRRALVETDSDQKTWRVFLPAHAHRFETRLHLDGCHYWTTSAVCECGVQYGVRSERSLSGNPYAAVWMEMPECHRCRELLDGARPIREVVIQRPRHYAPPLEVVA
jgi:hypothetical protein